MSKFRQAGERTYIVYTGKMPFPKSVARIKSSEIRAYEPVITQIVVAVFTHQNVAEEVLPAFVQFHLEHACNLCI